MLKKSSLFVLFVLFGLLFSSCSAGTGAEENAFSIGRGSSSSGGSGVSLEFAQGNPSSEMFKGQPSNFAFVFKNNQKHEITDLEIRPGGFDYSFVKGLFQTHRVQKIPRATDQTGPGVYAGLVVQGVSVDGFEGDYQFNPRFDYCYSAKTQFREQLCVPSKDNRCESEVTTSIDQNGPLSVKVDRVNSIANEIRIDFTISNTGSGQVVNTCFNEEDYANAYTISVSRLGSSNGKCEAVSGFQIINGKSNVYCTFPRNSEDSYGSQFVLELEYKYQQDVQKSIVVKDPNVGFN